MLDSNAWIHYLKSDQNRVRDHLMNTSPSDIRCCSIVKAKLFHGALKYGLPDRRLARLRQTFSPYVSLSFDDDAAEIYKNIRRHLEKAGSIISSNDLMIASISILHQCTLVTNNTREFSRVPGLTIEDWSI